MHRQRLQKKLDRKLFKAVITNDAVKVSTLIKKGANANAKDLLERTPLDDAQSHGYTDIAKILLEDLKTGQKNLLNKNPFDVQDLDKLCKENRQTTLNKKLFKAVIKNKANKVSELIEKGANANAKDLLGHTPLDDAISHGFTDIAKILRGQ